MICIQKIYSFHGLNHQIMEESWDVTPVTNGRTEDGKRKIGQCSGRPETAIVLQKLLDNMFPTGSSKRVREKVRDQQSWFAKNCRHGAFFAMHTFCGHQWNWTYLLNQAERNTSLFKTRLLTPWGPWRTDYEKTRHTCLANISTEESTCPSLASPCLSPPCLHMRCPPYDKVIDINTF